MSMLAYLLTFFVFELPIGYSMMSAAVVFTFIIGDFAVLQSIFTRIIYAPNSFSLIAIPLFMLAAELMNSSTITERIFNLALAFVGHIKGGLAIANVGASMLFGGMSGSGVADASGLGQIEIKAMKAQGYTSSFSAAVTSASACLGPIIPPSIAMVVFGGITGISTGRLLLGGATPGILMGILMSIVVYIIAIIHNHPSEQRISLNILGQRIKVAILPLFTPAILIGGILFGFFTPTEAAGIAVLYAMVLTIFIEKELTFAEIYKLFIKAALDCSAILFIVSCAAGFGLAVIRLGIADKIFNAVVSYVSNPTNALFLMSAAIYIGGCFMEDLSLMLILGPVFAPVANSMGINMVHFGVVMVLSLCLGMATPPVGTTMYISCYIADTTMWEYTKDVWPLILSMILAISLVILFPQLCLFLPNIVFGK